MNELGSPSKVCGRCGAKLPPNAPEGLCPRCLGALNLAGETVFTETETPRVPPPSPEQIAPHFPQLEIIECLGRGGMGVVYKARQKALGRVVALKLLAPEREKDPQFAERFAREAQALAQLNHPHIVTVYDFGQTNGFFYLLMEFVDGVNLRQLLRSRKLTPEEALAIVPPLCEALQFAHERGIVHRDIKPENLLLAKDGRIKVADFGIAKMLGDAAQIAEEKAAGTPGYMAPEQMEMPPRVDSRADIYSLGVVFYEMLTGQLPVNKFVPPSRKVAVDVRIDEVVLRALEKSPELRWQTAAEMRTSVEQVAASSHSSSAQGHGTAAGARAGNPSRWALLPLALIVAIVCGSLASWISRGFSFAPLIGGVVAFAVPVAIGVLVEGRHRIGANGLWTALSPWLLMAVLAAMPVLITAGYAALQATPAPPIAASTQPASATPRPGAAQFAPGMPQPAVEATAVPPRINSNAELATPYAQFDQTSYQGWRALAEQKRFGEAAELIRVYLGAHPELRADERINLHFHAAQCLAFAGGAKSVQEALEHLTHARYTTEPPDSPIRWNDYVSATEAFLRGDLQALKSTRERIASGPKLNGEQANLDVVDRLIANFDKSYAGAYAGSFQLPRLDSTPPAGAGY